MTRLDDFDLVAFDADDTLWQSEDSFNRAELAFFELVGPHCPVGVDVEEALRAVERADLSVSGYGVKAFTISMVRAAISASNRTVPVEVIEQLVEIG
jgi:putative hydrolase of the HAD superfamily